MKLKTRKIFIVMLILMILFYCFLSIVPTYAIDFTQADKFINHGSSNSGLDDEALKQIGSDFSDIGRVLVYIGAGILVGGLAYIGIMYMISPPEKQAKLKQQLIGLVVAGVVIFGAFSIWSILVKVLSGTIGQT